MQEQKARRFARTPAEVNWHPLQRHRIQQIDESRAASSAFRMTAHGQHSDEMAIRPTIAVDFGDCQYPRTTDAIHAQMTAPGQSTGSSLQEWSAGPRNLLKNRLRGPSASQGRHGSYFVEKKRCRFRPTVVDLPIEFDRKFGFEEPGTKLSGKEKAKVSPTIETLRSLVLIVNHLRMILKA